MAASFRIVIEWDPDGYYVASVPGIPGVRMEGQFPDDLIIEMREVLTEAFPFDEPPEGWEVYVVQRP